MAGRFVNIIIPGTRETLTLCEVEVYGVVEGKYTSRRYISVGCAVTFAAVIFSVFYLRDPSAKCGPEQNGAVGVPGPVHSCQ